jgi:S1-C subfamily serine protease
MFDPQQGVVLTSSSILLPFFNQTKTELCGDVEVIFRKDQLDYGDLLLPTKTNLNINPNPNINTNINTIPTPNEENFVKLKAFVLTLFSISEIENTLPHLTSHLPCDVGWSSAKKLAYEDQVRLYDNITKSLPYEWRTRKSHLMQTTLSPKFNEFVLLQLQNWSSYRYLSSSSHSQLIHPATLQLGVGDSIKLVSSPFGCLSPKIFYNSHSNGIISNVMYSSTQKSQPILYLTDAKYLPGSEGGGIFDSSNRLVGVAALPLKWGNLRHELNFFFPIDVIQTEAMRALGNRGTASLTQTTIFCNENRWSPCQERVVLVQVGSHWCSGVMISSEGHVLTNAHVMYDFIVAFLPDFDQVRYHSSTFQQRVSCFRHLTSKEMVNAFLQSQAKIRIRIDGSHEKKWYTASVYFISPSHLDIALLQVKRILESDTKYKYFELPPSSPLYYSPPRIGTEVFAIGYGVFGPSAPTSYTTTSGIISNIFQWKGRAVVMQTTALVHNGNSGGAIVDKEGNFLGLVFCNVRLSEDESTIPSLNFSICSSELLPISSFLQSHHLRDLECLESADESLHHALWDWGCVPVEEKRYGPKFRAFLRQQNSLNSKL